MVQNEFSQTLPSHMRGTHIGHMTSTETARQSLAANNAATLDNANNCSSHNGTWIRGLRVILTEAQGFTCAGCGESLIGERVELCHINSFKCGYGICAGNAYAGCKPCNDYDRKECKGDALTIIARMVRPDLVATVHPDDDAIYARSEDVRATRVREARGALA